jgi:hypothetical protein
LSNNTKKCEHRNSSVLKFSLSHPVKVHSKIVDCRQTQRIEAFITSKSFIKLQKSLLFVKYHKIDFKDLESLTFEGFRRKGMLLLLSPAIEMAVAEERAERTGANAATELSATKKQIAETVEAKVIVSLILQIVS